MGEEVRFPGDTGAGLMRNRCAFTSRDMTADWADAFTYAVVAGLSDEDAVAGAEDFGWDDAVIAFLRQAHDRFKALD